MKGPGYICPECSTVCFTRKALICHIGRYHSKPKVGPNSCHCYLCGKTFNNLKGLRGHTDTVQATSGQQNTCRGRETFELEMG